MVLTVKLFIERGVTDAKIRRQIDDFPCQRGVMVDVLLRFTVWCARRAIARFQHSRELNFNVVRFLRFGCC